jgi:hypothetical protein
MTANADPKRNKTASSKEAIRNGHLVPTFIFQSFFNEH